MKRSTVFKWHSWFEQGRKSIEDDHGSERAKIIRDSVTLPHNERWCRGSPPNTMFIGTTSYSTDGLIVTRSVF